MYTQIWVCVIKGLHCSMPHIPTLVLPRKTQNVSLSLKLWVNCLSHCVQILLHKSNILHSLIHELHYESMVQANQGDSMKVLMTEYFTGPVGCMVQSEITFACNIRWCQSVGTCLVIWILFQQFHITHKAVVIL